MTKIDLKKKKVIAANEIRPGVGIRNCDTWQAKSVLRLSRSLPTGFSTTRLLHLFRCLSRFFTQALLVRSMVDSTQGGENPPKGVPPGQHSYGCVYALRLAGELARCMYIAHTCNSSSSFPTCMLLVHFLEVGVLSSVPP